MWTRFRLRLVAFTRAVARAVTAALLAVGLTLLYFIGIGLTRAVMSVFRRAELSTPPDRDSFWTDAADYAPTLEDSAAQS